MELAAEYPTAPAAAGLRIADTDEYKTKNCSWSCKSIEISCKLRAPTTLANDVLFISSLEYLAIGAASALPAA
jgi:hypothetical protein